MIKKLVNLIKEHKFVEAENEINSIVPLIMEKKIFEMKKAVAAKMSEQMGVKSASDKVRTGIMEDEIEESINPTEIHNGPAPKGQRVNSVDKGDKQPPNTTVVPKNNIKEEDGEESSMARSELNAVTKDAKSIMSKIKGNKELEAWTQSKITKAADYLNSVADYMSEEEKESLEEARINIVKARVRGGKIQRRKKVSNVPGMTLRGGTLKRMSAAERRRRKMGARKGKAKRKAKLSRSLMKRKRSLQKRKSLGL
jgi:hypothetical protein